jgi:hypothetical protein
MGKAHRCPGKVTSEFKLAVGVTICNFVVLVVAMYLKWNLEAMILTTVNAPAMFYITGRAAQKTIKGE